jgi:hypothetical protein
MAAKINALEQEVKQDIIFRAHSALILENCKKMYFEVYCKIYNTVEIKEVSAFLKVSEDEAEIWIVNLIRKNNIKSQMNASEKCIVVGEGLTDQGDVLNKKAKELMSRNRILMNNVSKLLGN